MDLQGLKKKEEAISNENKISNIKGLLDGLKNEDINSVEPNDNINIDIISLDGIENSSNLDSNFEPSSNTVVIDNDLFSTDNKSSVEDIIPDNEVISLEKPPVQEEKYHIDPNLTKPEGKLYNTQILNIDFIEDSNIQEINLDDVDEPPIDLNADPDNDITGLDSEIILDYSESLKPEPEIEPTKDNESSEEPNKNLTLNKVSDIISNIEDKSELEKEIEDLNRSIEEDAEALTNDPYITLSQSNTEANTNNEDDIKPITDIDSIINDSPCQEQLTQIEQPNDREVEIAEVDSEEDKGGLTQPKNIDDYASISKIDQEPANHIENDEITSYIEVVNEEIVSNIENAGVTSFIDNKSKEEVQSEIEEIDLTGNDKGIQVKVNKVELDLDDQHIDYITYNKLSPSELISNREIILRLERAIIETGNNFIIDESDIKNIDDRVMKYKYKDKNIYQFREIPEYLLNCPKRVEVRTKYLNHINKIMEHFTTNEDGMYLTLSKINKDGYLILTKQEEQELINSLTKKFVIVENSRNTLKCLELQYE